MNRIRELRERKGIQQKELAIDLGISQPTVSDWESGRKTPSANSTKRLADYFGVSMDYLTGRADTPGGYDLSGISNISFPAARPIPILGEICAGNGIDCRETYDGEFFIDRSIRADFCLHVHGNSMLDEGIHDGDIAFFRRAFEKKDGEIYAVILKAENLAKIRQVYWKEGSMVLIPRNSADKKYIPEIADADDIYVAGEYIGVFHSRK